MTQTEINNIVWKACDSLRGSVDPTEYKDYVLTMLFVKYLSDVWNDKKAAYSRKYAGDEERIARALKTERFIVPEVSTFEYLYKMRGESNVGEIIDRALDELEIANRAKLKDVFRGTSFNSDRLGETRDRNRRLKNVLEDFNDLKLGESHLAGNDVIGDAYEFLIERFADSAGKKAGEFYTPKMVSTLLAKLIAAQPGHRICDPACGSGSLLIKVAKEVGSTNFSAFGQEVNGSTYALCKMNMFLHGFDSARIEWGDTLNSPKLTEGDALMRFHIVVANPPFSLDKWGAENAANDRYRRFFRGVPPKSKGDFAFICHMVETTFEGTGRTGVIVPHGVLFRGGSEGAIRQKMIEENLLEAVVGLPANLFFGTGIPAAILIFNRGKGDNRDVLFIDASREYESGKNQNKLREQDIAHVVGTYRNFKNSPHLQGNAGAILEEKYAYRATFADIAANDFNLNIPRYVDTFEEDAEIDLPAVQAEIAALKAELHSAEETLNGYLRELGI